MTANAGTPDRAVERSRWSRARDEVSASGLARAVPIATRDATYVVIGLFMLVSAALAFFSGYQNETFGFDFRGTIWDAAVAIRQGDSPYPAPIEAEVQVGNPALYPPLLMLVALPLTLMPWWLGLTVWTLVGLASITGALAIVGVRDPRCFAIAIVCAPTVVGLAWGNATLLLVPAVAVAWRWRAHPLRAGAIVGLAIAAKLFLWPLVFWLLGTRRYRAATVAAGAAALAIVGPWAVIGFAGLASYPDLLRVAEAVYATHSFSVAAMISAIGIDANLASRGAVTVGLVLATVAFILGRRAADEISFSTGVLAAILGAPIVWPFYYTLLLVPIAISRPRFSGIWIALAGFSVALSLPRPWLDASDVAAGGGACCVPDGVPVEVWMMSHAPPGLWPAAGHALVAIAIVASLAAVTVRTRRQWAVQGPTARVRS